MDKKQIELGDTVRDIYCGFVGVTTSKTEFVNGCIQYGVSAQSKKNEPPEEVNIDQDSLVVVKKGKRVKKRILNGENDDDWEDSKEETTGGPMRKAPRMRGF